MDYSRRPFPRLLKDIKYEIQGYAKSYGLDFYNVIFEVLDYAELNMVAAYGGFPTRYPHWRFGMEYEELSKSYAFGLSKIYELVINNDPCYAYLLKSNSLVDQKIVMSHVFGHCDFFKNNYWFSKTNRKMMDEMANHGMRMRTYMDQFGYDRVETFIDACLSIENLIDPHSPFIARKRAVENISDEEREKRRVEEFKAQKFTAKSYMDRFINPPEILRREEEDAEKASDEMAGRFPAEPERDIMQFLLDNAPLKPWQQHILGMIREEAYYFSPQGMTKIMNEGWASFWHSKIMTEKVCNDSEIIDFADHHSGTLGMRPGSLNPYKIGIELFRHIEDRWNRGKFGKEWEDCDDLNEKKRWNKKLKLGREKIFQVRKIYNDVTFIEEFMDQEFCDDQKLFVYGYNKETNEYVILDRDHRKVKEQLLFVLTNFGQPYIYITDANYKNRGELFLDHGHVGMDLKVTYAVETLKNMYKFWTRPVHLKTVVNEQEVIYSFDGKEIHEEVLSEADSEETEQEEEETT
jgi:stage V sporulation protein R